MRFSKQNIIFIVVAAALAASVLRAEAAFNPPGQAPPGGNVDVPVYSVGSSQSLSGGLSVTSGGFVSTGSSGTGIQGTGAIGVQGGPGGTTAVYGVQNSGANLNALYGFASSGNYAGRFEGIVNINALLELSSGAGQGIRLIYQDTGITWPDSTGVELFGIYVKDLNDALRLVGHGGGIELTDKSLNVRLSVSEAGVVNVASGGALRVNNVNVCLSDGTNCPPPDLGAAGGWTDDGEKVRLTTPGDSVGIGTTAPSSKLQVNPATNVEGVRVVSSNYSPIIARNTADSADLFRVDQSGNITAAGNVTASGALSGTTLNTGLGAYELYAMDQNVRIADSPTFSALTVSNDVYAAHNKSIHVDNAGLNTTILIGNYGDLGGFSYGTNYTASLAVEGNVKANGLCIKEDCRTSWAAIEGAQTLLQVLNTGSDASTFAGITAIGGTVGIGTTAPNTKLTVYNSGGGIIDLETSDATVVFGDVLGELQFRGLDASVTHQVGALIRAEADQIWNGNANDAPTRLAFYTQSDGTGDGLLGPQLTIRSSGNIGIGTASPGDNLHVYTSTTQTTPQIYIEQNSTGDAAIELGIIGDSYIIGIDNSDSDKFKISYSTTKGAAELGTNDRLVIDASGNVTVGGTITSTGGFSGPGSNLTGLNASNLSSGTVPLARLSGITTTELSVSAGLVAGQISPNIVSSVDGVSVDGGNIDLVAGSGITLVPDNGAKTITISAAGGGTPADWTCTVRQATSPTVNYPDSTSATANCVGSEKVISGGCQVNDLNNDPWTWYSSRPAAQGWYCAMRASKDNREITAFANCCQ